jgi:hypothetical protein
MTYVWIILVYGYNMLRRVVGKSSQEERMKWLSIITRNRNIKVVDKEGRNFKREGYY